MNHRLILFIWALALSLITSLAQAVTCNANMPPASNPDSAYSDNGDGTVTHTPTGLIWKRCAEGQTWSGGTCTGSASSHTWAQALTLASTSSFAGKSDWRLPDYKELSSLVEECRTDPAINDAIFPNTPGSYFWSGSPFAGYSYYAWYVLFGSGYADGNFRSSSVAVRLVRGGQSFDHLGAAVATSTVTSITPTSAYLNVLQQFTITGTNLTTGMGFSIQDCELTSEVPNTGSSTSRIFQCTPRGTAGVKNATVKTAPNGTVIPIAGAQTTPITIGILPTVTSVTPTTATLGVSTTFTVTGTNLTSGMGFSVEGCNPSNTEVGTGSATQRSFACVPEFAGTKNVLVKTAPGGTELFRSAAPATPGAVPVVVSDIVVSKALMVALSGAGAMTITSDPAGIDCRLANGSMTPDVCWHDFSGATVTLSANVDSNNSFGGWSGCDSQIADVPPKPPKCVVSTTAAKEVGAVVNATSSGGGGNLCLT